MDPIPPDESKIDPSDRLQRQVNVADNSGATQNSHNITINATETHYHPSASGINSKLLTVWTVVVLGLVATVAVVALSFNSLRLEPASLESGKSFSATGPSQPATEIPPTFTPDAAGLAYARCDAAIAIPDWQLAYEHCRRVFDIDPEYRDISLRLAHIVVQLTPLPALATVPIEASAAPATTVSVAVNPSKLPTPNSPDGLILSPTSTNAPPATVELPATSTPVRSAPSAITQTSDTETASAALVDATAIAATLGLDPVSVGLELDIEVQRAQEQGGTLGIDINRVRVDPRIGSLFVLVPSGNFIMGAIGPDDQQPVREIYLDAYAIKATEVTNAEYAHCINAGVCAPPANRRWNASQYADHPVVNVTWSDADTFARWIGGQLPTEAQWEKACRGTSGSLYPWGDAPPETITANLSNLIGNTAPVPNQSDDHSPFQIADMAGSVREWVGDWYWRFYYGQMPGRNPAGPEPTRKHTIRGGAYNDRTLVTCVVRHSEHSESIAPSGRTTYEQANLGFRVVLPAAQ